MRKRPGDFLFLFPSFVAHFIHWKIENDMASFVFVFVFGFVLLTELHLSIAHHITSHHLIASCRTYHNEVITILHYIAHCP